MVPYPVQNSDSEIEDWLRSLEADPELGPLLAGPPETREAAGYGHTLIEICRQPLLWPDTVRRVCGSKARLAPHLKPAKWIGITGSGSSEYAGACAHLALQPEMGVPVVSVAGGWLLLEGLRGIPPARPGVLVSLARSGDSPESAAVVQMYLKITPQVHHIVITCNPAGRLATHFRDSAAVVLLDERTNDRSLVMTSSFTNLAVAARSLGRLENPEVAERTAEQQSEAARYVLSSRVPAIAAVARAPFGKAVFLGSGSSFGAARESALKMLEMNAGRIPTMAETYLGLRHGPMCLMDEATLVVAFLSSDPLVRSYEQDLLTELRRKQLGARMLVVGENVPADLPGPADTVIEVPGLSALGDDDAAVVDVVVGQLLAFFRCLAGGLRPDSPSEGVISRVVNEFAVHWRNGEE